MTQRLTTTQRGYGYIHRKQREQWRSKVEAGLVDCASCHEPIQPDDRWDLGHTEDRTDWTGPEHAWCNRSTTVAGMTYLLSPRQRPRPRQRNCENCGCEYRAGYREQRFCGRACANANKRDRKPEKHKKRKIGRWLTCSECATVILTFDHRRLTCNQTCSKRRNNRLTSERIMKRYYSDPDYRAVMIERAKARYHRRSEA